MGFFKKKAKVQPESTHAPTTKVCLGPRSNFGLFPSQQSPVREFVVSFASLSVDEMPFGESFALPVPAASHQMFQQLASNKASMAVPTAEAEPVLQMLRDAKSTQGEVRAAINDLAIEKLLALFAPFIEHQARREAEVAAAIAAHEASLKEKYGLA